MDSIHDRNDHITLQENTRSRSPSLLGNLFNSSNNLHNLPTEQRIYVLERKVVQLEKSNGFNSTLFGMFAIGCIIDYLGKR